MRIGTVFAAVVLVALPLSSRASAGQGASAGQHSSGVEDFVRAIYIHGLPHADAAKYDSRDSETLIDMLRNGDDAPYWPNITMVLGIIGDDCAVKPLKDFVEGRGADVEWSTAVYRGRLSGIAGLGHLANKRGNEEAVAYLRDSVSPAAWLDREIPWLDARGHEDASRRSLQLSSSAVLALALTGHDDAGQTLAALAEESEYARLRRLAATAWDDWAAINARGYREDAPRPSSGTTHASSECGR